LVGLKACGHLLTWKQRELIQGSSGQSRVVDLSSPSNLVQHTVVAGTARQKIVLADDNAHTRDQVRRLLAGDYEVFAARDGEEALRFIGEQSPDLVLTGAMSTPLD